MGPVDNGDGTVTFCLGAPGKQSVFIIGSWNDYKVVDSQNMYYQDYQGNRYFWTTISGIENGKNYPYYFIVDGEKTVGDPYARLVLDPWNDRYIPSTTFPDIPEYPSTVSGVPVAVYNTALDGKNYNWNVKNFKGVDQSQLIIYELLIRDFTGTEGQANGEGTIAGVMEHLDYIKSLGVNAVELLPIMEFNGNNSWGYNTNFYFAPDKFYGTPDDYRQLIDAIHERGMAVILDIVFNQSDGLHPWYQMYDITNNPFYNGTAPHAYSVLNDWNQDNAMVQQQWHDALRYWIEAYNIDGYRFDLVKGLGDNDSYANNGDAATNAYNASRVANMHAIQEAMNEINPDAIFINENLAGAQEENEMAEFGMLNWANVNTEGCQFAMGYSSNSSLNRMYSLKDSRTLNSTVAYLESHDEERLAYKQIKYGVSQVKTNHTIACRRLGSAAAQMILVPGAHMIWMFSEMGNAETTKTSNGSNNVDPKIVNWNLLDDPANRGLMENYAKLIGLRTQNPDLFDVDGGANFTINCGASNWSKGRTIIANTDSRELICVINPNIDQEITVEVPFSFEASRYVIADQSYGTGSSFSVADGTVTVPANAYVVVATSDLSEVSTIPAADSAASLSAYGLNGEIVVTAAPAGIEIYDLAGVRRFATSESAASVQLPAGIYVVRSGAEAAKVAVK